MNNISSDVGIKTHGVMIAWVVEQLQRQPQRSAMRLYLVRTLRRLVEPMPSAISVPCLLSLLRDPRLTDSNAHVLMPIFVERLGLETIHQQQHLLFSLLQHDRRCIREQAVRVLWQSHASRHLLIQDVMQHRHGRVYVALLNCIKTRLRELYEMVLDHALAVDTDRVKHAIDALMQGEAESSLKAFLVFMDSQPDTWNKLTQGQFGRLLMWSTGSRGWCLTLEILSRLPPEAMTNPHSCIYSRIAPLNCSFAKTLTRTEFDRGRAFFIAYFRRLIQKIRTGDDQVGLSLVLSRMLGCIHFLDADIQTNMTDDILECVEVAPMHLAWEKGWTLLTTLPIATWNSVSRVRTVVRLLVQKGPIMWNAMTVDMRETVGTLFWRIDIGALKACMQELECDQGRDLLTMLVPENILRTTADQVLNILDRQLQRPITPNTTDFILSGCLTLLLERPFPGNIVAEAIGLCYAKIHVLHQHCDTALSTMIGVMNKYGQCRDTYSVLLWAMVQNDTLESSVRAEALAALCRCRSQTSLISQAIRACLDHQDDWLRTRAVMELASVEVSVFTEYRLWLSLRLQQDDTMVMDTMCEWSKHSDRLDHFQDIILSMIEPYIEPTSDPSLDFPTQDIRLLSNLSPERIVAILRAMMEHDAIPSTWIKRLRILQELPVPTIQDVVPHVILLLHHSSSAVREEALTVLAYSQTMLVLKPSLVVDYYQPLFLDVDRNRYLEAKHAFILLKTIGSSRGRLPSGLIPSLLHLWKQWGGGEFIVVPLLGLCPEVEQKNHMEHILDQMEDLSIHQLQLTGSLYYLRTCAQKIVDSAQDPVSYHRILEILREAQS